MDRVVDFAVVGAGIAGASAAGVASSALGSVAAEVSLDPELPSVSAEAAASLLDSSAVLRRSKTCGVSIR